ncbi:MAG: hypothetical protein VKI83_11570 [Synechococcaceae cyanobacterium]|nr:hypothetical protein [Synechococcaceae cyanobacterium]
MGASPRLPIARQVADVQAYINGRQPIRCRLVVQRVCVGVIGPETEPHLPELLLPPPPARPQQSRDPACTPATRFQDFMRLPAPVFLEFSSHQLETAVPLLQVGRFLVIVMAARAIAELMVRLQLPRSSASRWLAC